VAASGAPIGMAGAVAGPLRGTVPASSPGRGCRLTAARAIELLGLDESVGPGGVLYMSTGCGCNVGDGMAAAGHTTAKQIVLIALSGTTTSPWSNHIARWGWRRTGYNRSAHRFACCM
jgi:hypothetical protein